MIRSLGSLLAEACSTAFDGRTEARCLVTDPDEHPDEKQGGVQRTVRLSQSANGEVVLVRTAVDAEDFPRQHDQDQCQPQRHTAQCGSAATSAGPGPRLARGTEKPRRSADPAPM